VAQKRSRTVERTASNRHPLKAPDRPPPKGSMPAQPASATPALEHRFSGPDSARRRLTTTEPKADGYRPVDSLALVSPAIKLGGIAIWHRSVGQQLLVKHTTPRPFSKPTAHTR
jgi:hypothetical protein